VVCPECGGWMVERREGPLVRYSCHTGHGFSPESLIQSQTDEVEKHLYSSQRALEEMILVVRGMLERARADGPAEEISDLERRLRAAEEAASGARNLIKLSG